MEDVVPPSREYAESIYRQVAAYMTRARAWPPTCAKAGCARCQACSGLQSVEALLQIGPPPVQISHAV